MAITIVATAGDHDANSYVTLTDAETILEAELNHSAWDSATDAQKNAALVQATRDIDTLNLIGEKYYLYVEGDDSYQPLHFPVRKDAQGEWYTSKQIPAEVEQATAIQAAHLLDYDNDFKAAQNNIDMGIESVKIGTFSESYRSTSKKVSMVCQKARSRMRKWIQRTVYLERG